MARTIPQRELRNDNATVIAAVAAGESFVVTRNGIPVGELTPIRRRHFVSADVAVAAFAKAPPIDAERLRHDLDQFLDHDVTPRG